VVTAPGETKVVDAPKPTVGHADVLVKIRACGICGTDSLFISMGGIPGHDNGMPLGHEPAGEVVEVGWGHLPLEGQGDDVTPTKYSKSPKT
jgi:(R,R)-butanediol dehydrogenase/meso-butanediol dehydrogenase/diacetyl reductase